jgi:hypothetical protein
MPRPKSATNRLEQARADHAAATSKLQELETARAAALLADDDDKAAHLDAEIEQQRRLARGFHDKIGLLQQRAADEEQARKVKEKAELIGRVEQLLAKRDAAAGKLAAGIKQSDDAFREMIDYGQAAIAAWGWASPDIEAALLSPRSITIAVTHEIFKTGARPRSFGGMDKPGDGIDYPGGACPDHRLRNLREQIKPLSAVCAVGSAMASSIMRTGRSTSHVEPTAITVPTNGQGEQPQRSEAQVKLASLLKQQAALADDPNIDETKYAQLIDQIVQAQTLVDAEKRMEQRNG